MVPLTAQQGSPRCPPSFSSWASAYSPREKVWLGGLALAILLVAIFALTLFFGNITTSSGEDVDFPVEGKHLTIRNIETYWRKVDPESDSGVQLDTKFIPAAEITLDSSGSGFLRFLFENPQGDLIGDSVLLSSKVEILRRTTRRLQPSMLPEASRTSVTTMSILTGPLGVSSA